MCTLQFLGVLTDGGRPASQHGLLHPERLGLGLHCVHRGVKNGLNGVWSLGIKPYVGSRCLCQPSQLTRICTRLLLPFAQLPSGALRVACLIKQANGSFVGGFSRCGGR